MLYCYVCHQPLNDRGDCENEGCLRHEIDMNNDATGDVDKIVASEIKLALELIMKCEPMQRGERGGAIMGMISTAIDAARVVLAKLK